MSQPSRMIPPMEADNAWWWEKAGEGVLAIQRCKGCNELRHPPAPMCNKCRSMEWDSIVASGKGTVASYTILHHPQFPGYEYPINIVLVDLEEGTRITSQLVDCDREKIEFGMQVTVGFNKDEDGFTLPVFRPAGKGV